MGIFGWFGKKNDEPDTKSSLHEQGLKTYPLSVFQIVVPSLKPYLMVTNY